MNPISHSPLQVAVTPCLAKDKRVPDLFNLRMLYRPKGDWQTYPNVYVPAALQPFMGRPDKLVVLHLEMVESGGISQVLAPAGARYVLTGIRLKNGEEHVKIPDDYQKFARFAKVVGIALSLAGAGGLLATSFPIISAIALLAGTHTLRTLKGLPGKPILHSAAS